MLRGLLMRDADAALDGPARKSAPVAAPRPPSVASRTMSALSVIVVTAMVAATSGAVWLLLQMLRCPGP